MPVNRKAIGKRASWFAEVESEELPCVHKHWWVPDRTKREYFDPGLLPSPFNDDFADRIRKANKVILTSDDRNERTGTFTRTGYIAVWTVADVEFSDAGLKFKFVDKICDLE